MRGLIYKDLYLIKNKAVANFSMVIIMVLMLIVMFSHPDFGDVPLPTTSAVVGFVEIIIVTFLAVMLYDYVIRIDSTREWAFYGVTIPGTDKEVVAAKYTVIFLIYFISFVLCKVIDIVMGLIIGEEIDLSKVVLYFILFNIFLNAVEMPFFYRYGADKAGKIRVLITLVLLLLVVAYFLFGNIEWFAGKDGLLMKLIDANANNQNMVDAAYISVSELLGKIKAWGSIIVSSLPYFVAISYYISYRISCRVYKKGALRDDI